MEPASRGPASLRRYVCRLRGGSHPILAEASDGQLYVVKLANNHQSSNLAFNEAMGAALFEAFGLYVVPWRPIVVSNHFIEENRECWIETPMESRPPRSGICFGARFLRSYDRAMYEILPAAYFEKIQNRADFWLAWLVDACAGHVRNREALFHAMDDGMLTALFIDHGHMFGGPEGDENLCIAASRYLDLRIYEGHAGRLPINLGVFAKKLKAERIWNRALALPDEWKFGPALSRLADYLNRLSSHRYVEQISNEMMVSFGHACARALACTDNRTSTTILDTCLLPAKSQERIAAARDCSAYGGE